MARKLAAERHHESVAVDVAPQPHYVRTPTPPQQLPARPPVPPDARRYSPTPHEVLSRDPLTFLSSAFGAFHCSWPNDANHRSVPAAPSEAAAAAANAQRALRRGIGHRAVSMARVNPPFCRFPSSGAADRS